MLKIREATIGDALTITVFQQELAWETEKITLDKETVNLGVISVFNNDSLGRYYVAESNGEVVACLLVTPEWSDWRNCFIWWLQSVYVTRAHRGLGVFRHMYLHLKNLAGEQGIAGLRLYVEAGNLDARRTYESLGMNSEHYLFYEWMRE
jgi:GNAT superfamily N-acetyltransferase